MHQKIWKKIKNKYKIEEGIDTVSTSKIRKFEYFKKIRVILWYGFVIRNKCIIKNNDN